MNNHSKFDKDVNKTGFLTILIISILILFLALYNKSIILYVIAYIIAGYDVLYKSIRNIIKGEIFDENFLMSIATVGAIILQEYPEAISVMLLYKIGEYFQDKAVDKSRKSIKELPESLATRKAIRLS